MMRCCCGVWGIWPASLCRLKETTTFQCVGLESGIILLLPFISPFSRFIFDRRFISICFGFSFQPSGVTFRIPSFTFFLRRCK